MDKVPIIKSVNINDEEGNIHMGEPCPVCHGRGERDCLKCHGKGHIKGKKCLDCKGRGYIVCWRCNGSKMW